MTNKSFIQDDNNRKNITNPNPDSSLSVPRKPPFGSLPDSDRVPGSQAIPADERMFEKIRARMVPRLILGVLFLAGIWYLVFGQGKPVLESELMELITSEAPAKIESPFSTLQLATMTYTVSPSPIEAATQRLINTQPVVNIVSPTRTPVINRATITPTVTLEPSKEPDTGCLEATSISLDDVGKNLCVQGTIINMISYPTNYMVVFSYDAGAFYWVSYDLEWSWGEIGTCYQVEGTVDQIGESPVLVFNYSNLPKECP